MRFGTERTQGALSFVPTPIGNLKDMTLRALEALREADMICCEDTRHSRPLLEHFDIHARLRSYHQHNEHVRTEEILNAVREGQKVCVISDAGMPGISDPGQVLIRAAIEAQIDYTVLPGPTAAVTAFVASGMGDGRFAFLGFLERKGKAREADLQLIDQLCIPAVLYEAPHRILPTLTELVERYPDRKFATARELTKQFESLQWFDAQSFNPEAVVLKGEYIVIISGGAASEESWDEARVEALLRETLAAGRTVKDAVRYVQSVTDWRKNDIYTLAMQIRG